VVNYNSDKSDKVPMERESIMFLQECIDLQRRKSKDYQSDVSSVVQADYYPSGVLTIYEIMNSKMLRMKSLIETVRYQPDHQPNFESLDDSAKDLANYCSFMAAWIRGKIPGQDPNKNMFNQPIVVADKTYGGKNER
jgi:hypothetical protein